MWNFKYLCSGILCLSIIESVSAMDAPQEKEPSSTYSRYQSAYEQYDRDFAALGNIPFGTPEKSVAANRFLASTRALHSATAAYANVDNPIDVDLLNSVAKMVAIVEDSPHLLGLKFSRNDSDEDMISKSTHPMIKMAMGIPLAWMLKEATSGGLNAVVSCSPMIINIAIATIFYSMYRACKKTYNYYYPEKHKAKQEKGVRVTEKEFETKPSPIVFPDTAEIISYENDENPINLINTTYRSNSINSFNKDLSDIVLEKVYGEIDLLLQNNSMLTTLCIQNNQINDDIVRKISIALTNNTFLEELVLDSHKISDVGFIWISLALLENKNLKKLYLTNTQVTNYGLNHLASALRKNKTLIALYIDGNNISDEGIDEVRDAAENLDILFIHPKESLKDQLKREVDESFKLFRHKLNTFFEKGGNIIKKVFRDPTVVYSSLSSFFTKSFLRTENSRLDPDDEIIDDGI